MHESLSAEAIRLIPVNMMSAKLDIELFDESPDYQRRKNVSMKDFRSSALLVCRR
jgi:hypothetical protein